MNVVKGTLLEVVAICGISLVIALTANSVRAKGSLRLGKDYFAMREATPVPEPPSVKTGIAPVEAPGASARPDVSTEPAGEKLVHGFRTVAFTDVVAILDDPNTAAGVNLIVDARNDDSYEEGHIPGAVQADHYLIEKYIDNVMLYAEFAEKVVVYCNGGDCEDSGLVCNDLMDAGVAWDKLYLYEGGWKEWTANDMPVVAGRGEEE